MKVCVLETILKFILKRQRCVQSVTQLGQLGVQIDKFLKLKALLWYRRLVSLRARKTFCQFSSDMRKKIILKVHDSPSPWYSFDHLLLLTAFIPLTLQSDIYRNHPT